jgi:putative peptidoglycan lipid II flippase
MIKRLFSSQSKTITGAAIILGAASFISRIIGVLRDRIFAHQFGAGEILDAYYAAFRIPDLVYNLLVVGALSAGFIPIFMELIVKNKKEAWRVTNSVINILGVALVVLCGILFVLTDRIVPHMVPGFTAEQLQTTIMLTRIMFLSPILLGLSSVVSGVLQSFRSFLIYALTPIMYNVGIIIGAVAFVPRFGIIGLSYGVVLGALLHLLVQLPTFFHHGFTYKPLFLWSHKSVKKIFSLMIPRTLGLATIQFNLIALTYIASFIGAGSIAVFNFANNLQYFPIGIIGISFAVAAFPTFAKATAENNIEKLIEHVSMTIRQILFFIIPLTILFLLLRAQIVRVVLGSGQFDWSDTILTANTLAFFSLSLFAQSLIPLFARVYYAMKDTWTPFIAGVFGSAATIAFAWYLKDLMGIAGLALAFSIGAIVQLSLLWLILRFRIRTLHEFNIIKSLAKISAAALIMTLIVQLLKEPLAGTVDMTRLWGIFSQGAIAGTVGLILYGTITYYLGVQEMHILAESMKKRWMKLAGIQGEIGEADEL